MGSFKGILSSTPAEPIGGVGDIDTASVETGLVVTVVEVTILVAVMVVVVSCWEIVSPPFSSDAHLAIISGSLTILSLSFNGCSIVAGVLSSVG